MISVVWCVLLVLEIWKFLNDRFLGRDWGFFVDGFVISVVWCSLLVTWWLGNFEFLNNRLFGRDLDLFVCGFLIFGF